MTLFFALTRGTRTPAVPLAYDSVFADQAGFERALAALKPRARQIVGVWHLIPMEGRRPFPMPPYHADVPRWKPVRRGCLPPEDRSWAMFFGEVRRSIAHEFWTVLVHHIRFALAANEVLGLPIVIMEDDAGVYHVAVRPGEGRLLDLRGAVVDAEMALRPMPHNRPRRGNVRFRSATPDELIGWLGAFAETGRGFGAFMEEVVGMFYRDLPDAREVGDGERHLFAQDPHRWPFDVRSR